MDDSPDIPAVTDTAVPEDAPTAAELEAAGQSAMFGDGADATPAATPTKSAQPYRVLARKYRPQTFSELIGQEPMVRTLANAIARDRLAHAFLMTGVRGVGKTSTARLIAKALNCIGPDGQGGPTVDPCGVCEHCVAIAEGRDIDVIEMDAASHTGVDDMRAIIEAVRYAAVSARYKIYIIDEVHMLSKNAFNALLKTLEEPPAHVKFLFATTEVEKLPVTVLSRTQRFDLRRITADMLAKHFGWVCEQEQVEAEPQALAMIAAAAEGSVRDGLSILDQAISHADLEGAGDARGKITAERVRDMLGLADKTAQRRLLGAILDGDGNALLTGVADQYALGVEPLALMRGMMDLVHRITVAQIGDTAPDAVSEEESAALADWVARLSAGQLHRLWQLLLKGYDEVRTAPDPLASAQMALLRVLHAADMPDPGKMARMLNDIAKAPPAIAQDSAADTSPAPAPAAKLDWSALAQQVEDAGHLIVASVMRHQIRVVTLEQGALHYVRDATFTDAIDADLRAALQKITGEPWQVKQVAPVDGNTAAATLDEEKAAIEEAARAERRAHPLVQATLAAFPDAELLDDKPDHAPPPHAIKSA